MVKLTENAVIGAWSYRFEQNSFFHEPLRLHLAQRRVDNERLPVRKLALRDAGYNMRF